MRRTLRDSCADSYGLPRPVVGWIYNHATKNYWRVADFCELDDLIQDGLMKAYECRRRYGNDIDPPHFMALVKTAFYRHITEMLRHSRAEQEHVSRVPDLAGEMSDDRYVDRISPKEEPEQDFVALVAQMPEALRRAVRVYLDNPRALRRIHLDETISQQLRRLTGFPERFDFETELRSWLWEADHLDGAEPV